MARRWKPYKRRRSRRYALNVLIGAGIFGAALGAAPIVTTSHESATLAASAHDMGVALGLVRERPPQMGDYWYRCDDARRAGTAPIYRGEPGYRGRLDAD